ncbi:helix-turn-helix domain-containing protein, partial [Photorhabdus luminescens]
LARRWSKGEKIIADKLGTHPSVIWPSRYFDENGNPIKRSLYK